MFDSARLVNSHFLFTLSLQIENGDDLWTLLRNCNSTDIYNPVWYHQAHSEAKVPVHQETPSRAGPNHCLCSQVYGHCTSWGLNQNKRALPCTCHREHYSSCWQLYRLPYRQHRISHHSQRQLHTRLQWMLLQLLWVLPSRERPARLQRRHRTARSAKRSHVLVTKQGQIY